MFSFYTTRHWLIVSLEFCLSIFKYRFLRSIYSGTFLQRPPGGQTKVAVVERFNCTCYSASECFTVKYSTSEFNS